MASKNLPLMHTYSGSYQKQAHLNRGVNSKNIIFRIMIKKHLKVTAVEDLGNN